METNAQKLAEAERILDTAGAQLYTLQGENERLQIDLDAAKAEIARLRATLKPFAKAAKCAEEDEVDNYSVANSSARHELTLGHLRRAARAYEQSARKSPDILGGCRAKS